MNTTEKYIYQVYTEKSFSKAAKALFISQPSLSAAVARRENELGFQIFDRGTKPISLTAEGHIYIDMLEEIMESENNMQRRVHKLSNEKYASIAIGGASSSAYYLLPAICGAFHRRYPSVEVTIDIGNFSASSSVSERFTPFQKLDRNELDAFLGFDYDTSKYCGLKIYSERLVVAMHKSLVPPRLAPYAVSRDELLSQKYPHEKEIQGHGLLGDIPFLPKAGSTGQYMSALLGDYRASSYKITNSRHGVVHFNMMCAGIGALLTSDCVIALSGIHSPDVLYFVFDPSTSTRNVYLITKKDSPFHPNMQKFISTAQEVCESGNSLSLYTPL